MGGAGGRTESHSEHVQCDNFQTAAGRPLARFQRDFPAQGVGRFLVCTEATGLAHTHSWISARATGVRLQGALPLVWSFHLHQHTFPPGGWRRFQGTFLQDESGAGKVKAPSAQTHVPSGFHVRAEGSRPRSPDHKESIAPSLRLPSPPPLNRDVARSLYPGLPAAAGKTQGRQQAALLTLCPASLSTFAANNPATPAPTTTTLRGFEVRLRPKVTTLSSCS